MTVKTNKKKRTLTETLGEEEAVVNVEKVSKKKLKLEAEESVQIHEETVETTPAKKIKSKKVKIIEENGAVEEGIEEISPSKKVKQKKLKNKEENGEVEEVVADGKKKKQKKNNGQVKEGAENVEQKKKSKISMKKPKKTKSTFKFLEFRKKLRGDNFITEIRSFLQLAQKRRVIAKYLEKRGKPLELVEALERIDKTNVLHVNYICQALHLLLMEIVANNKQYMQVAEQACRYLLKAQSEVINILMNSAQLEHKHTALKLLTAVVCVDAQLGKQLLNSSEFLTNTQTIEKCLAHNDKEIASQESVRKCYIHFVLSYLINGNVLLIQNILDRPALIHALISGLQFDDHITVCMVINTLKKYVLELPDISKTKKIHVFDRECCQNLAALYDWYGPKVYVEQLKKQYAKHEMREMVNDKELAAVKRVLHEFMLELLTSRKNGICFNAIKTMNSLNTNNQKHNVIPGEISRYVIK